MQLKDRAFQHTFAHVFVYNMLWEDAELDERHMGLDTESSVLAISAAGCGVAGMLGAHPRRIDAVDINRHHLALAALKATAARRMRSYGDFYDLFGRGWHPTPEKIVRDLADGLPRWMQRHWKRNHDLFERSLYRTGLTARMLAFFRDQCGVDAAWFRGVVELPLAKRIEAIDEWIAPVLERPWFRAFMGSPLQYFSLGVNSQQRDRYLDEELDDPGDSVMAAFKKTMYRLAETDLARNWFAWYIVTGAFNHEDPQAVPPYLRRAHHERSLESPTETRFHLGNLFDVLGEAGPNTWSHFSFCDAPDWMSGPTKKRLFDEVLRTGREGGVMLVRSVAREPVVESLGYGDHLVRMDAESDEATHLDRSALYRRVDFYRIHA